MAPNSSDPLATSFLNSSIFDINFSAFSQGLIIIESLQDPFSINLPLNS